MLKIVLVEPREAGNVGAAARVMKNFGFRSLTIAGPHPKLDPLAGWWASGADDVVSGAEFVPDLGAALAGCHLTVATTSLRGRTTASVLTLASLADLFAALASEQRMALVFGREDSGLTAEEIALCQRRAAIPTDPAFPTMNLAQAVGAFCFTLSQVAPRVETRTRPDAALVERLHQRLRTLLLETGFLHENNPDRVYEDFRTIAGRADLDEREVTILLGAIHQLEWALRKDRKG